MVIKASTVDATNLFFFDGLDYQKGEFIITYSGLELDSNKDLVKSKVNVGLKHKTKPNIVLTSNIPITSWNDGTTEDSNSNVIVDFSNIIVRKG